MISSGFPATEYIDSAVRHVLLRQGVLGIKVRREPSLPLSLTPRRLCAALRLWTTQLRGSRQQQDGVLV
jgi:hypothetical protein